MANYPAPVPPWMFPIRWLMPFVPGAAYAIAPERAQALYDLVGKTITLRMVEQESFVCEIDLSTGEASVSSFLCELCWAAAYAAHGFAREPDRYPIATTDCRYKRV